MTDEERVLRWARETWRSSAAGEREVALGAERIARRFALPKRAWGATSWTAVGAAAAVLGALAHGPASRLATRFAPPAATAISVELPAPAETPARAEPVAAEEAPAGPVAPTIDATRSDVRAPSPAFDAHRRVPSEASHQAARDSEGPSWIDVNDALAALDHPRAEKLLNELARRGRDANTRAKAYLGLAQLEEARQNCAAARGYALHAAATPDVEIKTMRRALELAARCAR